MKENHLTSKIKILKAKPEDYKGITTVYYKAWLDAYPNKKYRVTIDDIKYMYRDRNKKEEILKKQKEIAYPSKGVKKFVAKYDGKIVGLCNIIIEEDKNKLKAIYILPKYQGKGIGYMLWNKASKYFNDKNDTILRVAVYNDKAIQFYEKIGFKKTGKYILEDRGKTISGGIIPETEMIKKSKR